MPEERILRILYIEGLYHEDLIAAFGYCQELCAKRFADSG